MTDPTERRIAERRKVNSPDSHDNVETRRPDSDRRRARHTFTEEQLRHASEELIRSAYVLHKRPIIGNAVEVEAQMVVELFQRHGTPLSSRPTTEGTEEK